MGSHRVLRSSALVLILVTAVLLAASIEKEPQDGVTNACLSCICYAMNECDRNYGCQGSVCGPMRITYGYWEESGKPILPWRNFLGPDGAYVRCTTDLLCAAVAVRGYMARYKRDCNGDDVIDCFDYASIHKLGPDCKIAPPSEQKNFIEYMARFKNCSAGASLSNP